MSGSEKQQGGRGRLPIEDDDLSGVYQTRAGKHTPTVDDSAILTAKNPSSGGMTPLTFFVTLVIGLPIAALLAYVVIDTYETKTAPLPKPTVAPTPTPKPTVDPALVALEKKMKAQAAILDKQTALLKAQAAENKKQQALIETLSEKKAAPTPKPTPKPTPTPTPTPTPKPKEPFDLFNEKVKVLNLSGIDLDDPVNTPDIFDGVIRPSTMRKVIESLDRILENSGDAEIDDELIANVQRAKNYANDRLKKLK